MISSMEKQKNSVLEYTKRLGKSIAFGAFDAIKEQMPMTAALIDNNKDTAKQLYQDIIGAKQQLTKLKTMQDTYIFKPAEQLVKNLKADLKSGVFYHPERAQAAEEEGMQSMMKSVLADAGMEDLMDLLNGESDMSETEEADMPVHAVAEVTTGDALMASVVAKEQRTATHSLIQAQTSLVDAQLKTTRTLANMQFKHMQKQTNLITTGFTNMTDGFNAIINFNNEVVLQHAKNAQQYFATMTQLTQENNAILKEMVEMKRNTYKKQVGGEGADQQGKPANPFANGVLDLKAYVDVVKSNMENSMVGQMGMMLGMVPAMIAGIVANPAHYAAKTIATAFLGPTLRLAMKGFDKSLNGYLQMGLAKMADWGSKPGTGILGEIAKIFGVKTEKVEAREIDISKNIKEPRSWDGEDHHYLTQVIPSYLANIEAALSGGEARLFNSTTGKWMTRSGIARQARREEQMKANNNMAELRQTLLADFWRTSGLTEEDKKDKRKIAEIQQAIDDFFLGVQKAGGFGMRTDDAGAHYKDILENQNNMYGTNQNLVKFFHNFVKQADYDPRIRQMLVQANGNIISQNRQDAQRRAQGTDLTDVEKFIASNSDMNASQLKRYELILEAKQKALMYNNKELAEKFDRDLRTLGDQSTANASRLTPPPIPGKSIQSPALGLDAAASQSLLGWQSKIYDVLCEIRDKGGFSIFGGSKKKKKKQKNKKSLTQDQTNTQNEEQEENHGPLSVTLDANGYPIWDEDYEIIYYNEQGQALGTSSKSKANLGVFDDKVQTEQAIQHYNEQRQLLRDQDELLRTQREHSFIDGWVGSDKSNAELNAKISSLTGGLDPEKTDFFKQLANAASLGDKMGVISANIQKLANSPRAIFTSVLMSADKMMYEFMFGKDTGEKDENGEEVHGLFNKMKHEMTKGAKSFSDKISEISDTISKNKGKWIGQGKHFLKEWFNIDVDAKKKELQKQARDFADPIKHGFQSAGGSLVGDITGALSDTLADLGLMRRQGPPIPGRASGQMPSTDSDDTYPAIVSKDEAIIRPDGTGTNRVRKSGLTTISDQDLILNSEQNPWNPNRKNADIDRDADNEDRIRNKIATRLRAPGGARYASTLPGFASGKNIDTDKTNVLTYLINHADAEEFQMILEPVLAIMDQYGLSPDDAVNQLTMWAGQGAKDLSDTIGLDDKQKKFFGELFQRLWRTKAVRGNKNFQEKLTTFARSAGYEGKLADENELAYEDYSQGQGIMNGMGQFAMQALGTDPVKAASETKKYIIHNTPELLKGGMAGALLGTVFPLGGPLFGAVAGSALSVLSNNKSFMNYIFGTEVVENGEKKRKNDGLISAKFMKSLEKYIPDAKKYGITGTLLGLVTPFGPMGGLMAGLAASYIKNNESARNFFFGDNGGLLNKDRKAMIKKALPNISAAMLGTLFLGPFGLVGNAVLGAGLGMLSTTEMFKKMMLGAKDRKGIRHGGLAGAIRRHIVNPLKANFGEMKKNFAKWFRDDVTKPIGRGLKPIGKEIKDQLAKGTKGILNSVIRAFAGSNSLFERVIDKTFSGIRDAGGVTNYLAQKAIGGSLGWIAKKIEKGGNYFRKKHIQNMTNTDLTSGEELQEYLAAGGKDEATIQRLTTMNGLTDTEINKHSEMAQKAAAVLSPETKTDIIRQQAKELNVLMSEISKITENYEYTSKNQSIHSDLMELVDQLKNPELGNSDIAELIPKVEKVLESGGVSDEEKQALIKVFSEVGQNLNTSKNVLKFVDDPNNSAALKEILDELKENYGQRMSQEDFNELVRSGNLGNRLRVEVGNRGRALEQEKEKSEANGDLFDKDALHNTAVIETEKLASLNKMTDNLDQLVELTKQSTNLMGLFLDQTSYTKALAVNNMSAFADDLIEIKADVDNFNAWLGLGERRAQRQEKSRSKAINDRGLVLHSDQIFQDWDSKSGKKAFKDAITRGSDEVVNNKGMTLVQLQKSYDIGNKTQIQSMTDIIKNFDKKTASKLLARLGDLQLAGLEVDKSQYENIANLTELEFACVLELAFMHVEIVDFGTFVGMEDADPTLPGRMIQFAAIEIQNKDGTATPIGQQLVADEMKVLVDGTRANAILQYWATHNKSFDGFAEKFFGEDAHGEHDSWLDSNLKGTSTSTYNSTGLNKEEAKALKSSVSEADAIKITGRHTGLPKQLKRAARFTGKVTKGVVKGAAKLEGAVIHKVFDRWDNPYDTAIKMGRFAKGWYEDQQFYQEYRDSLVDYAITKLTKTVAKSALESIKAKISDATEWVLKDPFTNVPKIKGVVDAVRTGLLKPKEALTYIDLYIQGKDVPLPTSIDGQGNIIQEAGEHTPPPPDANTNPPASASAQATAAGVPGHAAGSPGFLSKLSSVFSGGSSTKGGFLEGLFGGNDKKKEEESSDESENNSEAASFSNSKFKSDDIRAAVGAVGGMMTNGTVMSGTGSAPLERGGQMLIPTQYGVKLYTTSSADGAMMEANTKDNAEVDAKEAQDTERKERSISALENIADKLGAMAKPVKGKIKKATGGLFDSLMDLAKMPFNMIGGVLAALGGIPLIGPLFLAILSPIKYAFGKIAGFFGNKVTETVEKGKTKIGANKGLIKRALKSLVGKSWFKFIAMAASIIGIDLLAGGDDDSDSGDKKNRTKNKSGNRPGSGDDDSDSSHNRNHTKDDGILSSAWNLISDNPVKSVLAGAGVYGAMSLASGYMNHQDRVAEANAQAAATQRAAEESKKLTRSEKKELNKLKNQYNKAKTPEAKLELYNKIKTFAGEAEANKLSGAAKLTEDARRATERAGAVRNVGNRAWDWFQRTLPSGKTLLKRGGAAAAIGGLLYAGKKYIWDETNEAKYDEAIHQVTTDNEGNLELGEFNPHSIPGFDDEFGALSHEERARCANLKHQGKTDQQIIEFMRRLRRITGGQQLVHKTKNDERIEAVTDTASGVGSTLLDKAKALPFGLVESTGAGLVANVMTKAPTGSLKHSALTGLIRTGIDVGMGRADISDMGDMAKSFAINTGSTLVFNKLINHGLEKVTQEASVQRSQIAKEIANLKKTPGWDVALKEKMAQGLSKNAAAEQLARESIMRNGGQVSKGLGAVKKVTQGLKYLTSGGGGLKKKAIQAGAALLTGAAGYGLSKLMGYSFDAAHGNVGQPQVEPDQGAPIPPGLKIEKNEQYGDYRLVDDKGKTVRILRGEEEAQALQDAQEQYLLKKQQMLQDQQHKKEQELDKKKSGFIDGALDYAKGGAALISGGALGGLIGSKFGLKGRALGMALGGLTGEGILRTAESDKEGIHISPDDSNFALGSIFGDTMAGAGMLAGGAYAANKAQTWWNNRNAVPPTTPPTPTGAPNPAPAPTSAPTQAGASPYPAPSSSQTPPSPTPSAPPSSSNTTPPTQSSPSQTQTPPTQNQSPGPVAGPQTQEQVKANRRQAQAMDSEAKQWKELAKQERMKPNPDMKFIQDAESEASRLKENAKGMRAQADRLAQQSRGMTQVAADARNATHAGANAAGKTGLWSKVKGFGSKLGSKFMPVAAMALGANALYNFINPDEAEASTPDRQMRSRSMQGTEDEYDEDYYGDEEDLEDTEDQEEGTGSFLKSMIGMHIGSNLGERFLPGAKGRIIGSAIGGSIANGEVPGFGDFASAALFEGLEAGARWVKNKVATKLGFQTGGTVAQGAQEVAEEALKNAPKNVAGAAENAAAKAGKVATQEATNALSIAESASEKGKAIMTKVIEVVNKIKSGILKFMPAGAKGFVEKAAELIIKKVSDPKNIATLAAKASKTFVSSIPIIGGVIGVAFIAEGAMSGYRNAEEILSIPEGTATPAMKGFAAMIGAITGAPWLMFLPGSLYVDLLLPIAKLLGFDVSDLEALRKAKKQQEADLEKAQDPTVQERAQVNMTKVAQQSTVPSWQSSSINSATITVGARGTSTSDANKNEEQNKVTKEETEKTPTAPPSPDNQTVKEEKDRVKQTADEIKTQREPAPYQRVGSWISEKYDNATSWAKDKWNSWFGDKKDGKGKGTRRLYGRSSEDNVLQTDSQWSDIGMNIKGDTERQTVFDSFCGGASLLDVARRKVGLQPTREIVQSMVNASLPYKGFDDGISEDYFADVAPALGLNARQVYSKDEIKQAYADGKDVILMGQDSSLGMGTFGRSSFADLKAEFDKYDLSQVEDYNRPDFQYDSITVLRAKLDNLKRTNVPMKSNTLGMGRSGRGTASPWGPGMHYINTYAANSGRSSGQIEVDDPEIHGSKTYSLNNVLNGTQSAIVVDRDSSLGMGRSGRGTATRYGRNKYASPLQHITSSYGRYNKGRSKGSKHFGRGGDYKAAATFMTKFAKEKFNKDVPEWFWRTILRSESTGDNGPMTSYQATNWHNYGGMDWESWMKDYGGKPATEKSAHGHTRGVFPDEESGLKAEVAWFCRPGADSWWTSEIDAASSGDWEKAIKLHVAHYVQGVEEVDDATYKGSVYYSVGKEEYDGKKGSTGGSTSDNKSDSKSTGGSTNNKSSGEQGSTGGGGFWEQLFSAFRNGLDNTAGGKILRAYFTGFGSAPSSGDGNSGSSGDTKGGNAVTSDSMDEGQIWDWFISKGYNAEATAGIMGRLKQEHNFDPKLSEKKIYVEPSIGELGGFGIFQWTWDTGEGGVDTSLDKDAYFKKGMEQFPESRLSKYLKWCDSNKKTYESTGSELEYFWEKDKEDNKYFAKQLAGIDSWEPKDLNPLSRKDVVYKWTAGYERGQHGENDEKYANEFYDKFKDRKPSSGNSDKKDDKKDEKKGEGKGRGSKRILGRSKLSEVPSIKGLGNYTSLDGRYGRRGIRGKLPISRGLGSFGRAKSTPSDNASIWAYLKEKGVSNVSAAGIMGNFQAESAMYSDRLQGKDPSQGSDSAPVDGTTGYGLAQWTYNTRQQALKDFASSKGQQDSDWKTQIDFMLSGKDGDVSGVLKKMDETKDANKAALIFHDDYEQSADDEQKKARRGEYAKKFFESEGKGQVDGDSNVSGDSSSDSKSESKESGGFWGQLYAALNKALETSPAGKLIKEFFGADFKFGESGGDSSGGDGNKSSGGGGSTDAGIKKASEWANSMVGKTGYGNNGCTTFVRNYLLKADNQVGKLMEDSSSIASELEAANSKLSSGDKGGSLMWVPLLEQWAKDKGLFKELSEGGKEGDICVCVDHGHVIIADGKGGYWGNSSSKNQIVHSESITGDYSSVQGYINTGSGKATVSKGENTRSKEEQIADAGSSNEGRGKGRGKFGRANKSGTDDNPEANSSGGIRGNVARLNYLASKMKKDKPEDSKTEDSKKGKGTSIFGRCKDILGKGASIISGLTGGRPFGRSNSLVERFNDVKTEFGKHDLSTVENYNRPDYERDDLSVLQSKLDNIRQNSSTQVTANPIPTTSIPESFIGSGSLKEEFDKYDLSQVADYNLPDFESDNISVLRAKLENLKKLNVPLKGKGRGIDEGWKSDFKTANEMEPLKVSLELQKPNSNFGIEEKDYQSAGLGRSAKQGQTIRAIKQNPKTADSQLPTIMAKADNRINMLSKDQLAAASSSVEWNKLPSHMRPTENDGEMNVKSKIKTAMKAKKGRGGENQPRSGYGRFLPLLATLTVNVLRPYLIRFVAQRFGPMVAQRVGVWIATNFPRIKAMLEGIEGLQDLQDVCEVILQIAAGEIPDWGELIQDAADQGISSAAKLTRYGRSNVVEENKPTSAEDAAIDNLLNSMTTMKAVLKEYKKYDLSNVQESDKIAKDDDLETAKKKLKAIIKSGAPKKRRKNFLEKGFEALGGIFSRTIGTVGDWFNNQFQIPSQSQRPKVKTKFTDHRAPNGLWIEQNDVDYLMQQHKMTEEQAIHTLINDKKYTEKVDPEVIQKQMQEKAAENRTTGRILDLKKAPNGLYYEQNDIDYLLSQPGIDDLPQVYEILSKEKKYTEPADPKKIQEQRRILAQKNQQQQGVMGIRSPLGGIGGGFLGNLLGALFGIKPMSLDPTSIMTQTIPGGYNTPRGPIPIMIGSPMQQKIQKGKKLSQIAAPNGLFYEQNDIDYYIQQGKTMEQAIEELSKDRKYRAQNMFGMGKKDSYEYNWEKYHDNPRRKAGLFSHSADYYYKKKEKADEAPEIAPNGRHYSENDILYWMKEPHNKTREEAIEILSKEPKYTQEVDMEKEKQEKAEARKKFEEEYDKQPKKRRKNFLEKGFEALGGIFSRTIGTVGDWLGGDQTNEFDQTLPDTLDTEIGPNGLHYEKNDIDYLLSQGYTREQAIQTLSQDKKYTDFSDYSKLEEQQKLIDSVRKKKQPKRSGGFLGNLLGGLFGLPQQQQDLSLYHTTTFPQQENAEAQNSIPFTGKSAPNGLYYEQNDVDYLVNSGKSIQEAYEILSKEKKYTEPADPKKVQEQRRLVAQYYNTPQPQASRPRAASGGFLGDLLGRLFGTRNPISGIGAAVSVPISPGSMYRHTTTFPRQNGVLNPQAGKKLTDKKAPNGLYYEQNDVDYLVNSGKTVEQAYEILSKEKKYTDAVAINQSQSRIPRTNVPITFEQNSNRITQSVQTGVQKARQVNAATRNGTQADVVTPKDEADKALPTIAPNGKPYEENDIKYLVNQGYSRKEAITLLSQHEKYAKSATTPFQQQMQNQDIAKNASRQAITKPSYEAQNPSVSNEKINALLQEQKQTNKLLNAILQAIVSNGQQITAAVQSKPAPKSGSGNKGRGDNRPTQNGETVYDVASGAKALLDGVNSSRYGVPGYMTNTMNRGIPYTPILNALDAFSTPH